ncbi:group II intron reverse transcriptase/maturase [Aureliella helgolandensis]|uniref:Group II intron-encoded protein LtrA n=1 Tax=Aureliella helgolandensis TaxID=2527968 RepID=A0A518G5H0_9BACT|nr:group II intron reverse transcriptase/maturase [Aureliella helgolandensis]QDV23843.1 Group II intron-encoded protein LtrA [Aureliella helgolandensis]
MLNKPNKRERQMAFWESDDRIVPLTREIRSRETKLGNASGGKAVKLTRGPDRAVSVHRDGEPLLTRLDCITSQAVRDPATVFNNLFSLLSYELLYEAYCQLKRGKAPGGDGRTLEDYGQNVIANLRSLVIHLHRGSYRPQPSLRRDIPKGNGQTRPLGIACVEEKVVQRAIVKVLERIYEVDFVDNSYGFRPGRSCHRALSQLGSIIATRKVNFILDADIRAFFDTVSHEQLLELLGRRISDPRMLRLIERLLTAGVLIEGQRHDTDEGVPPGSCLSPLLANVYPHYVLHQRFSDEVKPRLQGEAYLIRYADDTVFAFERVDDAKRFQEVLVKRLAKYSLEVAQEKTKLIRFGRFAHRDCQQLGEGAPSTFDFLGLTHYCGRSRAGKFKLKRKTATKKFRQKVASLKEWFRENLTTPIASVWPTLNAKLSGHYQYYNVNDNWRWLLKYREVARRLGFRWMRRRSHKGSVLSWPKYRLFLDRNPLALPGRITDLIAMSRSV